jgi:eukaryotic-like serine/threonine-protein kinase
MALSGQPAAAPTPLRIGRYEILGLLGQGGMARVYLALQRGAFASQKLVVIKQLRPELVSDESFLTMFMDEARIALQLHHPNVVHTYEVGSEDGDHFLAMEFLEGLTLAQIIRKAGREGLSLPLHIWILSQVLAGLGHAHELRALDGGQMGIVHRDVTPSNVMITSAGEVKLLDFGIAKATGALSSTQVGMIKGKLGYIAPEQWMGRPSDARADLFAVAVMLWEAIAGRRRVVAETSAAAIEARIQNLEPAIEEVVPDVPQSLAMICRRGLAHDPAARYASAAEFRADLDEFLDSTYARVGASMVAAQTMQLFSDDFTALRSRIERYVQEHRPTRSSDRASTLRDSESVTYIAESSIRPRKARRLGGIVAGLAAAVGVVLALSRAFAPPAPAAQAASGAQVAPAARSAPAIPVAPAVASAPVVHVSVVAYPKHAQLSLDGHRVDNPFTQELAARNSPHRLEASADGYQPSSQVVSFERDVKLVLELEKSARPRTTRGAVARPASAQVPQRADAASTPVANQPTRRPDSPPLPGQDLGGPARTPRSIDEKDLYQ